MVLRFLFVGKSFPRITITTENSPSRASVIEEGTTGTGHSEPDGLARSRASLPRSKTDSNIAYPLPEYQEARGTANLITEDGQLNYQALMRAVLVALNERPSQRICDVALSLLDALLDLLLEPGRKRAGTEQAGRGRCGGSAGCDAVQVVQSPGQSAQGRRCSSPAHVLHNQVSGRLTISEPRTAQLFGLFTVSVRFRQSGFTISALCCTVNKFTRSLFIQKAEGINFFFHPVRLK